MMGLTAGREQPNGPVYLRFYASLMLNQGQK